VNQRAVLTVLSVIAIATADAAVVEVVRSDHGTVAPLLLMALNLGLISVASIWAVFHDSSTEVRIGCLVIVCGGAVWSIARVTGFGDDWRLVVLVQTFTVAGTLVWLKRRGYYVLHNDMSPLPPGERAAETQFQFSLAQTFGATAFAAMLLAALRSLGWYWPEIARCILIGAMFAVPSWLAIWVAADAASFRRRAVVGVLLAAFLGLPVSLTAPANDEILRVGEILRVVAICLLVEVFILAAFAVARRAGYRFMLPNQADGEARTERNPDSLPNDIAAK